MDYKRCWPFQEGAHDFGDGVHGRFVKMQLRSIIPHQAIDEARSGTCIAAMCPAQVGRRARKQVLGSRSTSKWAKAVGVRG